MPPVGRAVGCTNGTTKKKGLTRAGLLMEVADYTTSGTGSGLSGSQVIGLEFSRFPLHFYKTSAMLPIEANRETMSLIDLPQGTLDLLILRTLSLEPQHGWGISERVQQMSSEVLCIQQGSLYPALHRLERRGLIRARWGTSENNRRARYYELTRAGRKQLETETSLWKQLTVAVNQVLGEA